MNSAVRGLVGCSKRSFEGPCSTTFPPSMKMVRCETSRAKDISWVTTSMVRPLVARSFMTFSTSPISSGSSADVGSSKKIISGPVAHIDLCQNVAGLVFRGFRRHVAGSCKAQRYILKHRVIQEKIVILKHKARAQADGPDLLL